MRLIKIFFLIFSSSDYCWDFCITYSGYLWVVAEDVIYWLKERFYNSSGLRLSIFKGGLPSLSANFPWRWTQDRPWQFQGSRRQQKMGLLIARCIKKIFFLFKNKYVTICKQHMNNNRINLTIYQSSHWSDTITNNYVRL